MVIIISSNCVFQVELLLFLALACFNLCGATSMDVITSTQFIKDPGSLVSHGSTFKLGFFSPSNSTSRYVGIWFNNISVITPAWVANRDNPLNGSSGVLTISTDGNLVVLDREGGMVVWSSNLTGVRGANRSAELTDGGNLILQDVESGKSVWESAQNLADTLLQGMRMVKLISWRSSSDPSIGSFTCGIDLKGIPEGFIWRDGGVPYWRSGPWVGKIFVGISKMETTYLDGYNLAPDKDGIYSLSLSNANKSTLRNLVLDSRGQLRERMWNAGNSEWEDDWTSYSSECDVFGKCGEFGFCNPLDSPICSCLAGFEPRNQQDWSGGNWSSGCVRRKQLQCESERKNGSEAGKQDGFLRLDEVKVPYLAQYSLDDSPSCRDNCLHNCSCSAYSYYPGFGCMRWSSNLIDIQQFRPRTGGTDLYIRLAYSELGEREDTKVVIIILPVVLGATILAVCSFFLWKWRTMHRESYSEMKKRNEADDPEANGSSQMDIQELPVFNIRKLVAATDDFHPSNKLGEGGFGPVYKGILSDGSEIAVKRLSRSSGQGLEEFKNEVMLISKLQHRNLVKLLGCCVEGEKMLVYEYMLNKSLDGYLFDPKKAEPLNWSTRFKIIEGICRGLLYLHRDSRLRIIHRDLKPSNILLDQELNPKISDFGMARIFGGNEDQANTQRVAGTYGYMSPEYAFRGQFSEKSDVFSLGVIVLEIVSGRRNTSFRDNDQALSLLGYAWKLWTEDNISALIHPVVSHPRIRDEVRRCIHVGLLCVQDLARDRPAASTVMSMLSSEIQNLPSPTQPAYTESLISLVPEPLQPDQGGSYGNRVTVTSIEGR